MEENMKKSLIEYITKRNNDAGNTDLKIENIRFNDEFGTSAFADVSFTWFLNGWEKHAELKDAIFIYRDGKWETLSWF